jgi:energy-coupling factor transporter ATP-binding protein EcfA2
MDIIHFALAIIVALTMMIIFLKEPFNNQDLKSRATIRKNRSLGRNKKNN